MTVQPWKASGIPDGSKPKSGLTQPHVCAGGQSRPHDGGQSTSFDPDGLIVDHANDVSSHKVGQTDALGLSSRRRLTEKQEFEVIIIARTWRPGTYGIECGPMFANPWVNLTFDVTA